MMPGQTDAAGAASRKKRAKAACGLQDATARRRESKSASKAGAKGARRGWKER